MEEIKYSLTKQRFINELKAINTNSSIICDNNRKELLEYLINLKSYKSNSNDTNNNLNDYLTKITDYSYKKKWKSLTPMQKNKKLEQFIKTLQKDKKIGKKLIEIFNNGKLDKYILYDEKKGIIKSIKNLEYNNDKEKYNYKKLI